MAKRLTVNCTTGGLEEWDVPDEEFAPSPPSTLAPPQASFEDRVADAAAAAVRAVLPVVAPNATAAQQTAAVDAARAAALDAATEGGTPP